MMLRFTQRGARAGESFWGCPNYPQCTGTRPVSLGLREAGARIREPRGSAAPRPSQPPVT